MTSLPRRRFLRTTVTAGIGLGTTGCTARDFFSDTRVHFRTEAIGSPPVGLVKAGIWLVVGGMDGRVVGLDRDDGEVQWEADAVDDLRVPPVAFDGELYVAGADLVSVNGAIEQWRTRLPAHASALHAVPERGAVAVGTEDGTVALVDGTNGERRWQSHLAGGREARVDDFAHGDGVVYAGSRDGALTAFDARTGAVRWHDDAVVSAVAADDTNALAGRRRVYGFRDGERAWTRDTGNNWTVGITGVDPWFLAGTRMDGEADVLSLSGDGERRWRHRLSGDAASLTPVVNGRVVVGVEGDRPGVREFTVDGDSTWRFETETSVRDVVAGNERVWAVEANGSVLSLSA
ncbi:PQQ-binding-like beta-propeller repeat protein [Salinigranum sp. GCM10025319]|uniref:outer membrane protein assembly factor BamB family protein n=1 Tax=Salinigranum sp. GCM10025319 TaxID=3252687 RepID=UPI003611491C